MFPAGGAVFPPRSFSPGPIGGQFGSGFGTPLMPGNSFGTPLMPGNGFGNQQVPFSFGQQLPFGEPNQFGSGEYERPRSRHASRHRSKSRRRRDSSSSSSDNERPRRGSPFAGPEIQYNNLPPFQNVPPFPQRIGSPVIPPRRRIW